MINDSDARRAKNLERLEKKRQLMNQRFEQRQQRLNEFFDRKEAQIAGKLNVKQEQIIEASLELLNENGLNSLSLRDIAKRLNMQAPALYWHFKNKENLVDYMAEAILQKEFSDLQPRRDDEVWQEWLIHHIAQLRKAMLAYKDGGRVVAGAHMYPAVTLAQLMEYSLASLTSAGVDIKVGRHIIGTAIHYTFGRVIEEQSAPTAEEIEHTSVTELLNSYPHIMELMKDFDHSPESANEDFIVGLQYIIKGSGAS